MSQENVEIVRSLFEAYNAGDQEALYELLDPNVVQRMPDGWPEPVSFGRDAVMKGTEEAREIWAADTLEPSSDFIDVGNRVALRFTWRGEGRAPDTHMEFTAVYTVRGRRISNQESFWDHAEALEALGLSEQDAHADS